MAQLGGVVHKRLTTPGRTAWRVEARAGGARCFRPECGFRHLLRAQRDPTLRERRTTPDFLNTLRATIEDSANSQLERGMLLGALAGAATKETGELLLQAATHLADPELRHTAVTMIATLGGAAAPEELAPAVDRLWAESTDAHVIKHTALAMGGLAVPSSIALLLSAVRTGALLLPGMEFFGAPGAAGEMLLTGGELCCAEIVAVAHHPSAAPAARSEVATETDWLDFFRGTIRAPSYAAGPWGWQQRGRCGAVSAWSAQEIMRRRGLRGARRAGDLAGAQG